MPTSWDASCTPGVGLQRRRLDVTSVFIVLAPNVSQDYSPFDALLNLVWKFGARASGTLPEASCTSGKVPERYRDKTFSYSISLQVLLRPAAGYTGEWCTPEGGPGKAQGRFFSFRALGFDGSVF
jgi:hypothetical protein